MLKGTWFASLATLALAIGGLPPFASAQQPLRFTEQNPKDQPQILVTPLTLSAGAPKWRFEVHMSAPAAPSACDFGAMASLNDSAGFEERPLLVEEQQSAAHSVELTLTFRRILPVPHSVLLTLPQPETGTIRSFTWRVSN